MEKNSSEAILSITVNNEKFLIKISKTKVHIPNNLGLLYYKEEVGKYRYSSVMTFVQQLYFSEINQSSQILYQG